MIKAKLQKAAWLSLFYKYRQKSAAFSDGSEFVVFEFQLVAHIHAERQQGNGNFGHNAGVLVFHIGVVAADIDDSTDHGNLLLVSG